MNGADVVGEQVQVRCVHDVGRLNECQPSVYFADPFLKKVDLGCFTALIYRNFLIYFGKTKEAMRLLYPETMPKRRNSVPHAITVRTFHIFVCNLHESPIKPVHTSSVIK